MISRFGMKTKFSTPWIYLSLFLLGIIFLSLGEGSARALANDRCDYSADISQQSPIVPSLKRGVNASEWWEDRRDRALTEEDLATIRDLGFDFIRLPLSPTWIQVHDVDERRRHLNAIRCSVIQILQARLHVVIDLHPSGTWDTEFTHLKPNKAEGELVALWHELQPFLDDLPTDSVFLSLYNEPEFETSLWWTIQGHVIERVRALYPRSTLIVTASPDDGWWKLVDQKPYDDPNLIYDIHYYEPMVFTHHGAEWLPGYSPAQAKAPIPYPFDPSFSYNVRDRDIKSYVSDHWDRTEIDKLMSQVAAWRDRNHVRVACLEFGVYRPHVDEPSRLRWIGDVRSVLDQHQIPWAIWEYRGPFGFMDEGRPFDEHMAEALGLGHSAAP